MPACGSLAFSCWVPVAYVIVLGHITNLCVTLYLHRSATHEGVKFHPVVETFMRGWLWLTTGITTVEWVACHRKHHAFRSEERRVGKECRGQWGWRLMKEEVS